MTIDDSEKRLGLAEAGSESSSKGSATALNQYMVAPASRRFRDLPGLLRGALKLVWEAAPREFSVSASLQFVASAGLAAQLLVSRGLLSHIIHGQDRGYDSTAPYIVALAIVIGIVGMANAARSEIQRTLSELVSRHAVGRVVAVSTAVDLLAFETPAFHDRQQRALISSVTRPLQMTTGLLGLVGGLMTTVAIGAALFAIQPGTRDP